MFNGFARRIFPENQFPSRLSEDAKRVRTLNSSGALSESDDKYRIDTAIKYSCKRKVGICRYRLKWMKGYDGLLGSVLGWFCSFKHFWKLFHLKQQPNLLNLHCIGRLTSKIFLNIFFNDDATLKLFPWQKINIFSISSYKKFMKNVCECIIDVVLQVIRARELLLTRHELLFRVLTFFQPKFNFVNVIRS